MVSKWTGTVLLTFALASASLAQTETTVQPAAAPLESAPVATDLSQTDPCCTLADTCLCPPCGQEGRFWVRGEYLLWWIQGADLPPLVTASPAGTPLAQTGVLGAPGTVVLFGDEEVNDDPRSGFRVRAGAWLDCQRRCGIEVGFFMLESQSTGFSAASVEGGATVGRPFFNTQTNQQDAQLVPGTVNVTAGSSSLMGADAVMRKALCCGCNYRLDFIAGYRYLRFDDDVRIDEALTPTDPLVVPGTRIGITDSFSAQNQFHGAVFGLVFEKYRDRWLLEISPRVNVGVIYSEVDINGNTVISAPGTETFVGAGGLLTQTSNIGTYDDNEWTVIPELDVTVGYRLTNNVRVLAGYSFLYLTNIIRAGETIDPVVNPNLIPPAVEPLEGPQRPAPRLSRTDAWVQGLSVGLEVRF